MSNVKILKQALYELEQGNSVTVYRLLSETLERLKNLPRYELLRDGQSVGKFSSKSHLIRSIRNQCIFSLASHASNLGRSDLRRTERVRRVPFLSSEQLKVLGKNVNSLGVRGRTALVPGLSVLMRDSEGNEVTLSLERFVLESSSIANPEYLIDRNTFMPRKIS